MILQLNELRDKLAGCWTGKNVGGVLGAPFECKTNDSKCRFLCTGSYSGTAGK